MLKNISRMVYAALVLALSITVSSGCKKNSGKLTTENIEEMSYLNITGITQDEINAIESLRRKYGSFVYGVNPSTEAFTGKSGNIDGFAAMFCDWLSGMFKINFRLKYYQWGELLDGMASGEIDFTGELMSTADNISGYFMSNPTINRSIKYYRIKGSVPLEDIIKVRNPRYVFLTGAVVAADVDRNTSYTIEPIIVDSRIEAHRMLVSGEADAFFGFDTAEGFFDYYGYDDVASETFFPMIFRSSCLSTAKEELLPIISVLNKAMNMNTGVLEYLTGMQKRGHQQFMVNKVQAQLTEEERAYIKNNPVVKFGAEFSNYPITFYDTHIKQWQGIFFEAMDEVSKLTGLIFERNNGPETGLLDLIDRLEAGEIQLLPELFTSKEYEGRFIWSDIPILTDNYVFVSRADFRNVTVNDVFYLKVGIRKHSLYSELFKTEFPSHNNFVEYDTQETTWEALRTGEFDLLFAGRRRLLIYTNYYEDAEFKLNLVFNHAYGSYFGYNKDAAVLKSIIDKTLPLIDMDNMTNQWIYKTFDYRQKMIRAQRPWLIGAVAMFVIILGLVTFLFIRSRSAGKALEKIVEARTGALAFETSKLQAVIASIPDLMFTKDTGFRYTQCNKHFEDFHSLREADILGKTDVENTMFTPEDIEKISKIEKKVMEEEREFVLEENITSPSTGKETVFETVKAPIKQNGVVIGIIAIIRDITTRKEMEKSLSLQTSLFKTMLSSLPDAVFCKNLNFKYTMCNNYMASLLGKKQEDIIGKDDISAFDLPPETAKKAIESDLMVMNERQRVMYEEWVPCADGVMRIFETVKSPLMLDNDVVGVMAIGRDITKRKEMEEEAMSASRAKSSFLANMSHELRTPLNVVIGLTDLVLEEEMSSHIKDNLIKISNAGNTLLSIVNDILDFSKIESGKLKLQPVVYYLSSVLNDIITLVLTRLGEKPIKFSLNIKDDLPNKLYGDDLRVKQILANLLTNAVKYTHEGKIELNVRCTRAGDIMWIDVAVSDTGMGIPKEEIGNLFLDYYQVVANSNRNIEGTGLGLPITKRLVEMMDGEIGVESEHGKGSTFHFRIKQGFVDDTVLGTETSERLRGFNYSDDKRIVTKKLVRVNLSYAKVLVVDDMQTNLDVASGILRKYQLHVDCINNGRDAIERIRKGSPVYSAVFMDHMMPEMDGIETVDRIRAIGTEYAKTVPIIALTANAIQGTEKMFYAHDFQAFITKPIDLIEMDTVLRKYVYDSKHDGDTDGDAPVVSDNHEEEKEIKIQGVNVQKGLSLYAGETDIYIPLLRSYIVNTPETLRKLKTVSADNLSDYVITVHGLKGTSAGIGAEEIRGAALELETKSRAGDLDFVLAHNARLIADTEVLVANIKDWLDKNDVHEEKPRLKAPDTELLAKLKESCESYDMDGIDAVMKELEGSDYDEDADLVTWIREKIDISKLGDVAKKLEERLS
jgi:PAS domain S-box-containing protein